MSGRADAGSVACRIDGLAVRCHGPETAEPVLLSAGLGGGHGYWAPHVPALAAHHRVILYDHRGTGDSDRALPPGYTLDHLADDIERVLDGLGLDRAHVVGHAAGGVAALRCAARTGSRIRSVTVINGWAAPDRHFVRCMEIRQGIMRAQGPLAYLRAQPLFLYPAPWISQNLASLDEQAETHAAGFQTEETLSARIAALTTTDLTPGLSTVTCPVLLVAAEDDMLVPVGSTLALREALSAAPVTLDLHRDGGHAVNITRAERFEAALLGFLADQAASRGKDFA